MDEIDAFERYLAREARKARGEPVTEEEEEEGSDDEPKPAPEKPFFDEEESLRKFDEKEENAILVIPAEVVNDIDDDWPMTEQEETAFLDRELEARLGV